MTMTQMYLFGVLVIVAKLTSIKAEVDCSQRPPHMDIRSCCDISLISDEIKEKCKSVLEEMNGDFGPHHGPPGHSHGPPDHGHGPPGNRRGPPHHRHGPHHECFISCVFNETGILVDGELQVDNLNTYLNEVLNDSESVEFVNEKFLFCNEKRQELASKMPDNRHGPPNCNTKHGGMLVGCVHMETFKDCPDSVWSDTDECNAAREHFNQCFSHGHFDKNNDGDDVEEVEEEDIEEI